MAYHGYLSLGGVEIVNAPRVLTYARSLLPGLKMTGCEDCPDLAAVLGESPYASPLIDQPGWFDESNPDTWGFLGFYPLSILGLDDSTRGAPVAQSIADGGFIGRVRHATREIRIQGLLIATSPCSLDIGMQWLKRALDGNGCRDASGGCEGDDLCFLNCCPEYVPGSVDPTSDPVRHQISLTTGWSEESGSWIAGNWTGVEPPSVAIGPQIDPPCDDVVFQYQIDPAGMDRRASFGVQNEAGALLAEELIRVRRVNQLYNPSFHQNDDGWDVVATSGVVLTAQPLEGRAELEVSSPQPVDEPVLATSPGDIAEILPAGPRSMSMVVESDVAACVRGTWVKGASVQFGESVQLMPGVPTIVSVGNITSPGGAGVEFFLLAPCEGESFPEGTYYISQAIFEESALAGGFFDGATSNSTPYAYRWLGTQNASPSEEAASGVIEVTAANGSGLVRPSISILNGDELNVVGISYLVRDEVSPEECLASYQRTYRKVTTLDGPRIIQEFDSCGASIVRVEFTLGAAVPWAYQILAPEFQASGQSEPVIAVDSCPSDSLLPPLSDPDCPLPPQPPRPPVPNDCVVDVGVYRRRLVTIPGDLLMPWQDAVAIVTLSVQTNQAVRQARVRFYPNPLNRETMDQIDACSYCGEFIVSYIPPRSSIVIDGMLERATVTRPGNLQSDATHLLYGSDGGPMSWPLLTCGLPYIMTVDTMPETTDVLTSDLELAARG